MGCYSFPKPHLPGVWHFSRFPSSNFDGVLDFAIAGVLGFVRSLCMIILSDENASQQWLKHLGKQYPLDARQSNLNDGSCRSKDLAKIQHYFSFSFLSFSKVSERGVGIRLAKLLMKVKEVSQRIAGFLEHLALLYQESKMEKVVEEYKKLKLDAEENYKGDSYGILEKSSRSDASPPCLLFECSFWVSNKLLRTFYLLECG
ncbi:hypothetical protein L1987_19069 [Smallanthus sonchifolius]|uniref:Uncharacterized protein n=1 Tax=Smallanthus sonchifolius TaxID=185202 RepID=A0ACB9J304_9ASTR|nr:hypothetical protein L1987_19069 [Smallanthus sonchifolius]